MTAQEVNTEPQSDFAAGLHQSICNSLHTLCKLILFFHYHRVPLNAFFFQAAPHNFTPAVRHADKPRWFFRIAEAQLTLKLRFQEILLGLFLV